MYFLDIEKLSAERPDAHPGAHSVLLHNECYHWCNPDAGSVLDVWTDIFYNALIQFTEEEDKLVRNGVIVTPNKKG